MADTANRVALYAAVGPELAHYEVDVGGAALTRRGTIRLPANVQYAWPHASRRFLYVASSDSASGVGGHVGNTHHVSALHIDPASGALSPHGAPIALPTRPIHMTTDIPSAHILVAFNNPSALRVYRVNRDGTPGAEVGQNEAVHPGIFAHQVRVRPDNRTVILVARGHDPAGDRREEPGGLLVFDYADGQLTNEAIVAPNGGFGFGPRHLDFHPTHPWVYVALERQNRLETFAFHDGMLLAAPIARHTTLADPANVRGRQAASTVHVHPNGRVVYVANRASTTTSIRGQGLPTGGDNTIAVFGIDPAKGEPVPLQHADTHGVHCRTFHIDPSGRLLVAAHIMGGDVQDPHGESRYLPAGLAVFRIGDDGRLDFVRRYDVEVGDRQLFWMGMVGL
ncbi:MAG TPA: beta-propeller fold lactonase family protein [Stellaceae bacterium]|nr:beta-propeller fold lactonase family protein [Stellaceae bacterium]